MTVIPYAPSPPEAPTFPSVPSDEEIYGPERYSGYYRHYVPPSYYASSTPGPSLPSVVQFPPPAQLPFAMGSMQPTDPLVHRDFKDDLARAAGVVTPGVSDVPNIRYALEALTGRRNDDTDSSEDVYLSRHQIIPQFSVNVTQPPPVRQSQVADVVHQQEEVLPIPDNWPVPPSSTPGTPLVSDTIIPTRIEQQRASFPPQEQQTQQQPQQPQQQPQQRIEESNPYQRRLDQIAQYFNHAVALHERGPAPPIEPPNHNHNHNPPRTVDVWRAQPDTAITRQGLEAQGLKNANVPPPLTHKPWILRPASLLLLAGLSVLMIAALVFSAVYSIGRNGFTAYGGSITSGQYFVFRVLPQLVGAAVLIYAQCVIAAMFRVYPFSAMASEDRRERRGAVFLPLYTTKTFLFPQLFGPWNVWVPTLVVWLANFSIPLLSSLYTVVLVDGRVWTWSTVQGVAWTLVALYVALLLATVVLFAFWRTRRTGMVETWDVKSIADVIFLVAQSNSLPRYRGLETAATRKKMRDVLEGGGSTPERLGYWTTPEVPENGVFWGIGVPTTEEDLENEKWDRRERDRASHPATPAGEEDLEKGQREEPWAVRHRYLPWCFRDSPIILSVVAGTSLLIALIAVSFVHSTDLRQGFLPHLSAAPLPGAFSPADFLYAFVPSLIGMVLYLCFQSLDTTLRVLAPWGELAREEGSRAETSLLLDYTACYLPWEATFKAVRHKHWRVAFITFLSPLFILLPVFGGGLFMALTPPTRIVRMYPNIPIFALIVAFLILYVVGLMSLVPRRNKYRLPHAVTCLAEIVSFCCNEQLRTDEAFDQARSVKRSWFKGALDCGKDWHRQGRWTFGAGRSGDERLGIKRFSRYTVNPAKLHQYDRYVRGKPISAPVLRDSGSMFGH